MDSRLIIALEDFPEEGRYLEGDIDGAVFDLGKDDILPAGPLHYAFDAQLYEHELVLRGSVATVFNMRCNRCLARFDYTAEITDMTLSFDVKGQGAFDATDALREEILLVLPGYPKCEHAGLDCEKNDTMCEFGLDKNPGSGVDSAAPRGSSVWDALDKLPQNNIASPPKQS